MRLNKFDLNNLVCLDALLAEKSITRAGDRLFLSRPAMSNALARLREYFNDEILTQVGKTMVPTPFALSLQAPVRDLLLRMQAVISASPSDINLATVGRSQGASATVS
ncbi:LysR family transcriptional regulator [Pseudomonas gessardii]|uniref:LysR family transcriptional regulator n=1 Tax=Pseudomonas gessardii TaxID=78544 RepID=A0ABS9FHT9_9PSED|nr:LysR family transcriptional regulator [Pseudomonas gessardii]MCF4982429.1 LysR family transcriptional regulator [Pseudomonas gessardii]MCF5088368.1 LysR family transcriptional regulator [Pseudomonas gessardii]MCF5098986.1 LysR family transcriptional regulator [Pseudomonas gessardii]MCF5111108.1 LysR family transcriptional regulator [Pseudomonas gessardii]